MEFTTHLELQSQATRLRYTAYTLPTPGTDGILTLSDVPFQGTSPGLFRKARMPQHPPKWVSHQGLSSCFPLLAGSSSTSQPHLSRCYCSNTNVPIVGYPADQEHVLDHIKHCCSNTGDNPVEAVGSGDYRLSHTRLDRLAERQSPERDAQCYS